MVEIENLRLLEETGEKDICVITWQLNEERRNRELKKTLEQHGFRVRFSGNMHGLMQRFVRLTRSARLTWLEYYCTQTLKYGLLAVRRMMQSVRFGSEEDVLYLLVSHGRTGDGWIHEEAQIRFEEQGARDRLFWYDEKTGKIMKYGKPVLGYLEYSVANHCNLRCKGCSHYSNLVRKPEFGNLDGFRKNLARLKELFDHVEVIRLLGGEPFLNPELGAFVTAAREAYPEAALSVVSNGLLIPKVKEEILETIRRNNAMVQISNYPPTVRMGDAIRKKLEGCGVRYSISRPILKFQYEVGGKAGNGRRNYRHCSLLQDHLLSDDGRLCLCTNPVVYEENRERLDTKREVSKKDWIDIHRVEDGCKALRRLHQPVPFCRYCLTRKKIMFPWKGNYLKELTRRRVMD